MIPRPLLRLCYISVAEMLLCTPLFAISLTPSLAPRPLHWSYSQIWCTAFLAWSCCWSGSTRSPSFILTPWITSA